uniref:Ig-like domain-containing protein n=1 Tax=Capra hircus TaxID=9925 RepID=A0A452DT56_CAPHI
MEERRGRGLGRDPAPGPRDPEKFCSAADPAQSTEREGQQSSHKDAGLVSVSGEEVLLTERGTQQTAGTMEPPSGPASRRHVPWSRLLLAVSLSTFWTPPTTAQLAVKTLPLLAAEGSHVLLAHNISENPLGYAWYRGESVDNTQLIASYRVATNATTNGAVYSRRETLYPNGTLLIQNVTQKDTGSYTLLVTKKDLQTERLTGHLCIYTLLPTPVITSNNSNPRQHEDTVVLTCRFETCDVFYMCSVNNQSLPNSMELELCKGNRTLTVFNVKRHDTGPCVREAGDPENVTHDDPSTQNGLSGENSPALNREIVIVIMIGILVRLALVTIVGCFVFLKMTRRASGQNDLREHRPPATTLGHGPSGSSVSPASLPSPKPAVPIYEELLYPNTDIYCQINPKVDVVS